MSTNKTVDIIGGGLSAAGYDWPDDHDKWSVGSCLDGYKHKPDLYFCFHKCDPIEKLKQEGIDFLDKNSYPLNDVVIAFGSSYFTNSIAYMIAYAMFKGYEQINLIGIDMDIGSEYEFERPCVLYWIGRAEGEGIKVSTTSNLHTTFFMYGYNDASNIIETIEKKRIQALAMAEHHKNVKEDILAAGWQGKARMCKELQNIFRS